MVNYHQHQLVPLLLKLGKIIRPLRPPQPPPPPEGWPLSCWDYIQGMSVAWILTQLIFLFLIDVKPTLRHRQDVQYKKSD